jgi:hypothetical protein
MGNEHAKKAGVSAPCETARLDSIKRMDTRLLRKFGTGVTISIKVVVRGERNTGKSSLMTRLQGKPYHEDYVPTPEIETGQISWSYKDSHDVVKVR